MHDLVAFNFRIVSSVEASLPTLSLANLYGKGVFTTIAVNERESFLWEKHWRRIRSNAEKLKIDLTEFSDTTTRAAVDELINQNNIANARVRITFFDTSSSKIWPFEATSNPSLLITTGDLVPVPDNFRLTVSPYTINSRSPLAGIKSCNYLEKLMAMDEAKGRGFDEAIQVNERGEVTSATMANVFWLYGGRLFTPSLATGCLQGTTREYVLENLECGEVEAGIEELDSADALYLTSAGLGITSVADYNRRKLISPLHPITKLLTTN